MERKKEERKRERDKIKIKFMTRASVSKAVKYFFLTTLKHACTVKDILIKLMWFMVILAGAAFDA